MDRNTIIALVLVVLLAAAGYGIYSLKSSSEEGSSATLQAVDAQGRSVSEASAEDQKFLAIITNLKNLTVDTSVLSHPAFRRLTDFGKVLAPEPLRKSNPFVPFSGAAVGASQGVSGGSASSLPR